MFLDSEQLISTWTFCLIIFRFVVLLVLGRVRITFWMIQDASMDRMNCGAATALCCPLMKLCSIVDAVQSIITIGQYADDALRSRMLTLLTTFAPSEILLEEGSSSKDLVQLIQMTQ